MKLRFFILIALCVGATPFGKGYGQGLTPVSPRWDSYGVVDASLLDTSLKVQLVYATSNNYLHTRLYADDFAHGIYLQEEVARMLVLAHRYVRAARPDLRIVVHDALRPCHIQQRAWDIAGTQGVRYLYTPPQRISMHSYGVAVDVSLVYATSGYEVDMGRSPDNPARCPAPGKEQEYLHQGLLTKQQLYHRHLLRAAMTLAGFRTISNEWWHFEGCTRAQAQQQYQPIP